MNGDESKIPMKYLPLYRQGREGKAKAAIRAACLECCGWQQAEVAKCTVTGCPLFNLRNKAAQYDVEKPDREKRRARSKAAGLRPPKRGVVHGHGDQEGAPVLNDLDTGGASAAE